jgi:hypothetical protein
VRAADPCALLHQQCYCFGADIRNASGNLLLSYGFERKRSTHASEQRSSQYSLVCGDGSVLSLFAFGFCCTGSDGRGAYVNRYRFEPIPIMLDLARRDAWSIDEAELLERAATDTARHAAGWWIAAGTRRIAEYEEHVLATMGVDYRRAVLASFDDPAIDPMLVPRAWRAIETSLTTNEAFA